MITAEKVSVQISTVVVGNSASFRGLRSTSFAEYLIDLLQTVLLLPRRSELDSLDFTKTLRYLRVNDLPMLLALAQLVHLVEPLDSLVNFLQQLGNAIARVDVSLFAVLVLGVEVECVELWILFQARHTLLKLLLGGVVVARCDFRNVTACDIRDLLELLTRCQ